MELRILSENEYEESLKLSMYAFQYEVSEAEKPARIEKLRNQKVLSIWDGEELAAKLHILPLSIHINGTKWNMGGVAGVATYPEYRRRGYVNQLISASLKEMKEAQQIISFLHPFDIGFYRRFGWEIFTDSKTTTIKKVDLKPLADAPGYLKRFQKDNAPHVIEKIYDEFAARYSGTLHRESKWWNQNVLSHQQIAVYYDDKGRGKGYILYSVKERFMDVQELVVLDQEGFRGIWNFICQHDSMIDELKVLTSVHEAFPFNLKQPKQRMEVTPYFMGRIVDVEKCLNKYSFNRTEQNVFIHVEDPQAEWNNGSYLIADEGIKAYKAKSESGNTCSHLPKVGVHMKINALAALLLGYKRPKELYELEQIKGSMDDILALEKKIPLQKSYFADFF